MFGLYRAVYNAVSMPLDGQEEYGSMPLDGQEESRSMPLDGQDEYGSMPLDGQDEFRSMPLDGQEELELWWQLLLAVRPVSKVDAPYPAVGVDRHPHRLCKVGSVRASGPHGPTRRRGRTTS